MESVDFDQGMTRFYPTGPEYQGGVGEAHDGGNDTPLVGPNPSRRANPSRVNRSSHEKAKCRLPRGRGGGDVMEP